MVTEKKNTTQQAIKPAKQPFDKLFPCSNSANLDTLVILLVGMEPVTEENLAKLMVIMKPSSEESDSVSTFDVECLRIIASNEAIVSNVSNLRYMNQAYEDQKKAFVELRLTLLRQLMEYYLTHNSSDTFMDSKYRDFMIK